MTDRRKLQGLHPRVETGVVQFGDDWPGVFIRGDDCLGYALALRGTLSRLSDSFADQVKEAALHSLAVELEGAVPAPENREAAVNDQVLHDGLEILMSDACSLGDCDLSNTDPVKSAEDPEEYAGQVQDAIYGLSTADGIATALAAWRRIRSARAPE